MTLTGDCLAMIELYVAAEYGYEVSAEIVAERGAVVTGQPDNAIIRSAQTRSVAVPVHWLDRFQEAYVAELTQWVHRSGASSPSPAPMPGMVMRRCWSPMHVSIVAQP